MLLNESDTEIKQFSLPKMLIALQNAKVIKNLEEQVVVAAKLSAFNRNYIYDHMVALRERIGFITFLAQRGFLDTDGATSTRAAG